ncbi:MAG: DUF1295 domain-containing protein [Ilumatobacteraceae bacterium]|jgi:steroid 5-alpha reductase family enzyme
MNTSLLAAVVIASLMIITWIVSLLVRNASIVDITWGFGFALVGAAVWLGGDSSGSISSLVSLLAILWGLRLTAYLAWRNIGHGEDFRYRAMRKRWGPRFGLISLGTVFGFQGLMMWVVSLPVHLAYGSQGYSIGVLGVVGAILWLIGMFFEAVGDLQLARFKADPANEGKLMDRGLWRYTRHPNYFGNACIWWGIAIAASTIPSARWGLVGAALMNVLLVKVSGVAMLERSLSKRKPGYEEYMRRTSSFIPRPPRP